MSRNQVLGLSVLLTFFYENMLVLPVSNGKHLKLKVCDPKSNQWVSANAWRKGYLADQIKENSLIDLAFTMSMDDWMGRKSLTLTVIDIKQRS